MNNKNDKVHIIRGYYMAKTILKSILHEREHYCVSVRPIAFLLERSYRADASAIMLERV